MIVGTLADLGALIDARGISGPATIVVGEVARLADPEAIEPAFEERRVAGRCA